MGTGRLEKKIILFIVEGTSDRDALSLIISRLINKEEIEFQVIHGDITADKFSSQQNIVNRIDKEVKKFLERTNGIKKEDILKIVHLIDIDGAYIMDEDCFVEDKSIKKGFIYTENTIKANKKEKILNRNQKKSSIISRLVTLPTVGGIEYSAYYFSCNLDHVLHNERNLSEDLKSEYAFDFVDEFDGRESEFIKFLKESDFTVPGDYMDTWKFIKDDLNSLGKYCNFHLFFSE